MLAAVRLTFGPFWRRVSSDSEEISIELDGNGTAVTSATATIYPTPTATVVISLPPAAVPAVPRGDSGGVHFIGGGYGDGGGTTYTNTTNHLMPHSASTPIHNIAVTTSTTHDTN